MRPKYKGTRNLIDRKRLTDAQEEYFTKGHNTVRCDECDSVIQITQLTPSVWQCECTCGKFTTDLKGL
jgi:hypothetical protein